MLVRDDCETLSTRETDNSESHPENPVEGGVLAALPRTRPQRVSARRAAARQRTSKTESKKHDLAPARSAPKTAASPKTARKATPTQTAPGKATPTQTARKTTSIAPAAEKIPLVKAKTVKAKPAPAKPAPKAKAASTSRSKPAEAPAPKQGYEPEEEVELGKTVNPPSGVELVESVADIFGELANSSLAAGGRILKDAFSLLRRP